MHTPGPWEAILDGDPRGQPQGAYRRLVALCEKGERYLAVVAERDVERESWPANAVLMAAAPDLLDACFRALRELRPTAMADGEEVVNEAPAHVFLQNAIAKATATAKDQPMRSGASERLDERRCCVACAARAALKGETL